MTKLCARRSGPTVCGCQLPRQARLCLLMCSDYRARLRIAIPHNHKPQNTNREPRNSPRRHSRITSVNRHPATHVRRIAMDPSRGEFASLQARLNTFAAPKTKARRPSARGKKAAPKTALKGAWPLESPLPQDLAYAGFLFKPTSASPDNVQCFHCQTQLDGWEPNDVPAYEHLTHSPNCGFALNLCIRLRDGDPGRNEEDPLSERMMEARRETFQDLWPLDVAAGYPSIDQVSPLSWPCVQPSLTQYRWLQVDGTSTLATTSPTALHALIAVSPLMHGMLVMIRLKSTTSAMQIASSSP